MGAPDADTSVRYAEPVTYQHCDLHHDTRQTPLAAALAALESEFELPTAFPQVVLDEALAAVRSFDPPPVDRTDIELVTIDPASSTDLDQAVHLARAGDGYVVHYAIADVPGFVAPGGALDAETRLRGQTVYLPHRRISLHPESISEDAGSLLPDRARSAYLWSITLDANGAVGSTTLERALVRSREKLNYVGVQAALDAGTASESMLLLREVGLKRAALEHERGGASLRIPEQEVELLDGAYRLSLRAPLPVEDWNAQISLLTGMEAARIMLAGGVGILRTMPEPDAKSITTFRRQAVALGKVWEPEVRYGDFLRSLNVDDPAQLALMHQAASLFRGAGYTAFDGSAPDVTLQAALGAPYSHATAPLRRLVDRFVLVVCAHLTAGLPVPEQIRTALPSLPALMQASNQRTGRVERAAMDTIEAALLGHRVGEHFNAVTIDGPDAQELARTVAAGKVPSGVVQLREPGITARYQGAAEAGREVTVELVQADLISRKVLFRIVES